MWSKIQSKYLSTLCKCKKWIIFINRNWFNAKIKVQNLQYRQLDTHVCHIVQVRMTRFRPKRWRDSMDLTNHRPSEGHLIVIWEYLMIDYYLMYFYQMNALEWKNLSHRRRSKQNHILILHSKRNSPIMQAMSEFRFKRNNRIGHCEEPILKNHIFNAKYLWISRFYALSMRWMAFLHYWHAFECIA